MLEIGRNNVKFVEGKVVNKKDGSGEIAFLTLQYVYAEGTEKEFTKLVDKVINNVDDNLKKFLETAKMGDVLTITENLV